MHFGLPKIKLNILLKEKNGFYVMITELTLECNQFYISSSHKYYRILVDCRLPFKTDTKSTLFHLGKDNTIKFIG